MRQLLAIPLVLIGVQFPGLAETILPGTQIEVRSETPITVSAWDRGRIYPGVVARDVFDRAGNITIPRGARAEFIVRQTGPGQLALDVESVEVNGNRYVVDTAGPQFNMPQTDYDNGSGVIASIMSAIDPQPGDNVHVEVRGHELHVPDGTVIRFQLQEPLHVATWTDPGYQDNGNHYHHDNDWYR